MCSVKMHGLISPDCAHAVGTEELLKFLNSLQPLGLLILRTAVGIIFFTHGYPKLTQSAAPMQALFVHHGLPAQLVYVAGVLETFGGLLRQLAASLRDDRRLRWAFRLRRLHRRQRQYKPQNDVQQDSRSAAKNNQ